MQLTYAGRTRSRTYGLFTNRMLVVAFDCDIEDLDAAERFAKRFNFAFSRERSDPSVFPYKHTPGLNIYEQEGVRDA